MTKQADYCAGFCSSRLRVTTFRQEDEITFLLADDPCCVRLMMNNTNEYRQVKVHRKKKSNRDTVGKQTILSLTRLTTTTYS